MTAAPAIVTTRIDWRPFDAALARATEAGFAPSFWWRDDDAARDTSELRRLLGLSRDLGLPIALAVVPARAEPSLAPCVADHALATALVHGLAHANHAPGPERKAEFGPHRPLAVLARDAQEALATAAEILGPKLALVFVPPWNRLAAPLIAALPGLGYCGVSTFKDRVARCPAPGLVQVNTHLDPVDWRGTRSLADPVALVATLARAVSDRFTGGADRAEPIGLLTHHLAHDETIWHFCEELLVRVSGYHRMPFLSAGVLF